MPVIDLADYLGMPQQAPAQPMFQATRNIDPFSSESIMRNADARQQMIGLQRQAPVMELQKAQLAYDTVAQQARDLRMKQEIEAQAEQAVNEMIGSDINPESDDYTAKLRETLMRNPLAIRDPRVKETLSLYDAQNRDYQAMRAARATAELKRMEDQNQAVISYRKKGGKEPITPGMSPVDIAALEGGLPRASRGASSDPEERRLEKLRDAAKDNYDLLVDDGSPEEIAAARLAYSDRIAALNKYYTDGAVSAAQPLPVAVAANAGGQPQATSFKDLMRQIAAPAPQGATGATEESTPFTQDAAKREQLNNIQNLDEGWITGFVAREDVPLADKERALSELKARDGKLYPDLDAEQAENKNRALKEAIKLTEQIVTKDRVIAKEVRPVLEKEMGDMEKLVKKFAAQRGIAPENVYRSIMNGSQFDSGRVNAWDVPIMQQYEDAVLGDQNMAANKAVASLLGKVRDVEKQYSPIATFFKNIFGSYNISNKDVLIQLAKERLGQNQATTDSPFESSPEVDEIARKYR